MVPEVGVEPTLPEEEVFEPSASAIPPLGHCWKRMRRIHGPQLGEHRGMRIRMHVYA